jgi:hypothetical protein
MPMPTFPLARLGGFRSELHACFTRRADALFELGDALLCAPAIPSRPHLSLEPGHQRGWGSVYAALARGRIDTEQLRDLLVRFLPDADPLVFAVDVTTWPRCDAECSPERGYYYHPSRHSAGQPIIAGWAFQWIAQLGFARDSWTAPVDARRLHPLDDTDHTAAALLHLDSRGHAQAAPTSSGSDRQGEVVERDGQPLADRHLDRQFVVAAAKVLDEGVPGDDDPGAVVLLESSHRSQPDR